MFSVEWQKSQVGRAGRTAQQCPHTGIPFTCAQCQAWPAYDGEGTSALRMKTNQSFRWETVICLTGGEPRGRKKLGVMLWYGPPAGARDREGEFRRRDTGMRRKQTSRSRERRPRDKQVGHAARPQKVRPWSYGAIPGWHVSRPSGRKVWWQLRQRGSRSVCGVAVVRGVCAQRMNKAFTNGKCRAVMSKSTAMESSTSVPGN